MAKEKKGVSGLGAAVVGAALGVTAAVLSDKKNRKLLKKTVGNVVDEGEKRIGQARKYIDDVSSKVVKSNAGKVKTVKRKKRSVKKVKASS